MNLRAWFFLSGLIIFLSSELAGQEIYPDNLNVIQFQGQSSIQFDRLFSAFNNLVLHGEGTINIVHIGDSHIQADFFSGEVRKRLMNDIASGCGARGLIFPFRMARSNNPVDYFVKYTGTWESCRNVEYSKECSLGVMGIMVKTKDSLSDIIFHFGDPATDFNFIRIYHNEDDYNFGFEFPGLEGRYSIQQTPASGFTEVVFQEFMKDSLRMRIVRKDTVKSFFNLYGVDFENNDAGITYNAAGVNGAEVISFLRCDLLTKQFAQSDPGLVIVSLGTNDAYPVKFDRDQFKENYKALIRNLRKDDPGLPVLLTIPGDSFRKRRYVNKNLPVLRDVIFEIARETDCAVWDFYSIMGGAKSIQQWYKKGLVAKDKLHFDKAGYIIQGDLLSDALINAYSAFIDRIK